MSEWARLLLGQISFVCAGFVWWSRFIWSRAQPIAGECRNILGVKMLCICKSILWHVTLSPVSFFKDDPLDTGFVLLSSRNEGDALQILLHSPCSHHLSTRKRMHESMQIFTQETIEIKKKRFLLSAATRKILQQWRYPFWSMQNRLSFV